VPGRDPAPEWDSIPGAPGCTAQALRYKAVYDDFRRLGFQVVGLSSQGVAEQREFAEPNAIPFLLLSDPALALADARRLPAFEAGGRRLCKRLAFVAERGVVVRAFYPVFPPNENAAAVLAWLADWANPSSGCRAPDGPTIGGRP
jgi:peroxiredoxin